MAIYEIETRSIPERRIAALSRHLHANETDAFFDDAFARLRSTGHRPGGDRRLPVPRLLRRGQRRQRWASRAMPSSCSSI